MLENQEQSMPVLIKDLGMRTRKNSTRKDRYGLYNCQFCNNKHEAITSEVNRGHMKQCLDCSSNHYMSHSKIYSAWSNMKDRCINKKCKVYNRYGGRGIKVCDGWNNSFKSFYDWSMANGYDDSLSIDRICNDGNYEPSNCRWTTNDIQHQNTRKIMSTNTSGYRGVFFHKTNKKYLASIGVNGKKKYLGYFDSPIEAAKVYDSFIITHGLNHTQNFAS
jgi:hypothetical protein